MKKQKLFNFLVFISLLAFALQFYYINEATSYTDRVVPYMTHWFQNHNLFTFFQDQLPQ